LQDLFRHHSLLLKYQHNTWLFERLETSSYSIYCVMFFLAAHNKQHHNRVRRRLRQVWEILHTGQIIAVATAFELTTNQ
jgi:hypothetical protein